MTEELQTIGWAVKQMHNGSRVRRRGWNGNGMFLFGIYPEGTEINYHAHVDMKTATGEIVPWLCSQSDLLATDWEMAE